MKLSEVIDTFISGDWGEETYSDEMPCAVTCVRGADIIPISEYNFSAIPIRYITQQSYLKKRLQVGDIIIEKSGGSPTQSTGRVSFVSQELLDSVGSVVCSNFCTAFRERKVGIHYMSIIISNSSIISDYFLISRVKHLV